MSFRSLVTVIALVLLTPGLTHAQSRLPEHFEWGSGDALAFIGDEATYDGRWCQYVENYFFTRYPDKQMVFYNAGSMNDTAADVLARLEDDVIERKIDICMIMLGTFDGQFEDFDRETFATYQENMRLLLDDLKKRRIHAILVSPPMFDMRVHTQRVAKDESYRFRIKPISEYYNGVMGYYTSWLRDEAMTRGLRFVDGWGALNAVTLEHRKLNPEFSIMTDAILPDAGGHAVIAGAVIEALAPERESLGSIRLYYMGSEKGWESRADGGSISSVSGSTKDLSFIWKAKSLPWAFPDEAMIGVDAARIDERFNFEKLTVVGLEEGEYQLIIAGDSVGEPSYSSKELALGIDLHAIPDRPQYLRAQAVAKMNEQRYEASIYPLRKHWQQIKRTRVNFPNEPDRVKEIFSRLEPEMNTLRNQAREKNREIYEASKPLGRNFELKKIGG